MVRLIIQCVLISIIIYGCFGYNTYGQLGLGDRKIDINLFYILHYQILLIYHQEDNHTFVKTLIIKYLDLEINWYSQLGIKTQKNQLTPIQVLEGKEDIWCSTIGKSRAKSARK